MHPHVISEDGVECLYMQDTWLVTADGGEPLTGAADAHLFLGRLRFGCEHLPGAAPCRRDRRRRHSASRSRVCERGSGYAARRPGARLRSTFARGA